MKALTLILLFAVYSPNLSHACSCADGTWPLDPTDALIYNARAESGYGRSAKIDPEADIEVIKSYPSLAEQFNLFGYKGTSCEVKGPNGESHFYCATKDKADYRVTVRSGTQSCTVVLQAKTTRKKVKVKVLRSDCPRPSIAS